MNIGDLVRAIDSLKPSDEATRVAVARVLGLRWAADDVGSSAVGKRRDEESHTPTERPGEPVKQHQPPTNEAAPEPAEAQLTEPEAWTSLEFGTPREEFVPEAKVGGIEQLDATPNLFTPPLFTPIQGPRILGDILRVWLAEGDIDADGLVTRISRAEPMIALARKPRSTLRFGAQVLEDRSDRMQPFIGDCANLMEQLHGALPREQFEHLGFGGDPLAGVWPGTGGMYLSRSWRLRPGVPILIVSDLGPSRGASRAWTRVFVRARQRGCPVVVLSPGPLAPLAAGARWILWDRTTTGRSARQ